MLTDACGILRQTDVVPFILAGNSEFTVKNETSGNQFTYRVRKADDNKKYNNNEKYSGMYFIKVCTGYLEYNYGGMLIIMDDGSIVYKKGTKGNISDAAQSIQVLMYILKHAYAGTLNSCVSVYHTGKCGRCGRKLTDAISIQLGLGPECRKKV